MTLDLLQQRFRLIAIWNWGFMALCLPFSTALTLIFSYFGVLFGLLGFDWLAFKKVMRSPIAILCVALFAWLALSMFWSIAPLDELIEGISKYRKLLYVPLVAMLLVSTRVKPGFLMNFFLVGCLVVCIGSLSSSTGLLEHLIGPQLPGGGWGLGGTPSEHWFYIGPPWAPTFGRAWIAQGAFLVFSTTYLMGVLLSEYQNRASPKIKLRILGIVLSVLIMVLVMLNLGGRTGYLLLSIAVLMWTLKLLQWRRWLFSSGFLLASIVFVAGVTLLNLKVVERTQAAFTDVSEYRESGAYTSQGLRLLFWEAGFLAALDKPLYGWGVGSYAEVFSRDVAQPATLANSRPHPHSEYVLLAVQGGGIALWAIVCMVFFSLKASLSSCSSSSVQVSVAFILTLYLIDAAVNSVIWDLGEGHALAFIASTFIVTQAFSSQKSVVT